MQVEIFNDVSHSSTIQTDGSLLEGEKNLSGEGTWLVLLRLCVYCFN